MEGSLIEIKPLPCGLWLYAQVNSVRIELASQTPVGHWELLGSECEGLPSMLELDLETSKEWVYIILAADHLFSKIKPKRLSQAETMEEVDHQFLWRNDECSPKCKLKTTSRCCASVLRNIRSSGHSSSIFFLPPPEPSMMLGRDYVWE